MVIGVIAYKRPQKKKCNGQLIKSLKKYTYIMCIYIASLPLKSKNCDFMLHAINWKRIKKIQIKWGKCGTQTSQVMFDN